MVQPSDFERARACLDDALRRRQELTRRLARAGGCSSLNTLLESIRRRKTSQASELLAWMSRHGKDPVSGTVPPAPVRPNQSGTEVAPAARVSGEVNVMDYQALTPSLIRFTLAKPAGFYFVPGQSVKLRVEGVQRSYSIVSAPHEDHLEFFVELVAGGRMSERLRRLQPGASVIVGRPKGGFRFDEAFHHHLMLATVTGINPFVSILRDYVHRGRGGHRFHVLQGASLQTEFGYREELEALAARYPGLLTYVPTVSRPEDPENTGWSGSQGRVDAIIDDYVNRAGLDSNATLIYACGHTGMLDVVMQRYQPRGFRVVTESYD